MLTSIPTYVFSCWQTNVNFMDMRITYRHYSSVGSTVAPMRWTTSTRSTRSKQWPSHWLHWHNDWSSRSLNLISTIESQNQTINAKSQQPISLRQSSRRQNVLRLSLCEESHNSSAHGKSRRKYKITWSALLSRAHHRSGICCSTCVRRHCTLHLIDTCLLVNHHRPRRCLLIMTSLRGFVDFIIETSCLWAHRYSCCALTRSFSPVFGCQCNCTTR